MQCTEIFSCFFSQYGMEENLTELTNKLCALVLLPFVLQYLVKMQTAESVIGRSYNGG